LAAFERQAKLLGLVGTDMENVEAITREARTQRVRIALRTALGELRNKVGAGEAGPIVLEHSSSPEPDEGEIC
jgi:hypothetical protein